MHHRSIKRTAWTTLEPPPNCTQPVQSAHTLTLCMSERPQHRGPPARPSYEQDRGRPGSGPGQQRDSRGSYRPGLGEFATDGKQKAGIEFRSGSAGNTGEYERDRGASRAMGKVGDGGRGERAGNAAPYQRTPGRGRPGELAAYVVGERRRLMKADGRGCMSLRVRGREN